jgi:oligopeptide/dipeptide ABC transporter ATP-binding protein
MADDVAVMYAGKIVEHAPTHKLYARPQHPYTLGLLESIPRLDRSRDRLVPIPGRPPALSRLGPGCSFAPRCRFVEDRCWQQSPELEVRAADHRAACWLDAVALPK